MLFRCYAALTLQHKTSDRLQVGSLQQGRQNHCHKTFQHPDGGHFQLPDAVIRQKMHMEVRRGNLPMKLMILWWIKNWMLAC